MSSKKESKENVIMLNVKPFEVPPGGTLGVLALGNIGVKAWKKAKREWEKANKDEGKKA